MDLPKGLKRWKKGERSAFDFWNRGYRGAWLLADGTMITQEIPEVDDEWGSILHSHVYKKIRDILAAESAVRISAPDFIQIYFFPVSTDQKEDIARLFWEKKREYDDKYPDSSPLEINVDFSPAGKHIDWYHAVDAGLSTMFESMSGSIGDFLRALEKFEQKLEKEQKKNERTTGKRRGSVKASRGGKSGSKTRRRRAAIGKRVRRVGRAVRTSRQS